MRIVKYASFIILSIIIWTVFIAFGVNNGFLLTSFASKDKPKAFIEAVKDKIDEESVGNLAMVLIEDGQIVENYFYSIDQAVNENTVFPLASISKWVTSWGVMKLVEECKIDLDKPIDSYLTRWHLPESKFDNKKVTVRRLLSHTAGLVDDLGYAGFPMDAQIQTIEESLTKASDAPWSEGVARVGMEPGTQFMYSGAAYTILQLLIEEISGQSFQTYMTETVLKPLKMERSTFVLSEKPEIELAQLFLEDGSMREAKKFTALAAASLFSSTADLSKFLMANIYENPVLSQKTIALMVKPEAFTNGIGIYGMGPDLYSQNDDESTIIGHDGSGETLNTTARIDLKSRSGIIVLETGHYDLASSIADEWVYWKAGIADRVVIERNIPYLITLVIMGYLFIIICSVVLIRKSKLQNVS